jgi:drug/metabolite transporter (DMT)-like permease
VVRFREPLDFAAYRPVMPRMAILSATVSVTVLLYTYSIQNTTAANAALLVNSAPIYVAVLAPLLLHEARARYTWLSLVLAVAGIILVSDPANLKLTWDGLDGIIAGALSGMTYAVVMVMGRSLRGRVTGLTQTLWSSAITGLILLPWALRAPTDTVIDNLPLLIPLGIFSLGLSYLFYFIGLQRISAQVVSVVALFEPVSGILIGLLAFEEVPNGFGLAGAALILGSITLISRP